MAIFIEDGNEEIKDEAVVEPEAEETEDTEKAEEAVIEEEESEESEETEEPKKDAQQGKKQPYDSSKKKKDRHKNKKPEKDKRDEQIEELTEHLKRNLAEFDNFRKRTEKEKAAMFDLGARSVIEKLLPVVDNFERGLASIGPDQKVDESFANGMDMVYKQLLKLFEDLGVQAIETEGKEFDPNLHNAVMHVDDDKYGENMIAQEFQKGYKYKDTVIRHSMVQVAN